MGEMIYSILVSTKCKIEQRKNARKIRILYYNYEMEHYYECMVGLSIVVYAYACVYQKCKNGWVEYIIFVVELCRIWNLLQA